MCESYACICTYNVIQMRKYTCIGRHIRTSTKPSDLHLRSCPLGRWIFSSPDPQPHLHIHTYINAHALTCIYLSFRTLWSTYKDTENIDQGKVSLRVRAGDINCTNYGWLTYASCRAPICICPAKLAPSFRNFKKTLRYSQLSTT